MKDIKEMVTKLLNVEKEVSHNKEPFNLFALFLRNGESKWDLLISSEWMDKDKYYSLKYIVPIIQRELTTEELLEISGIEIIDHDYAALNEIYETVSVEHSIVEKTNVNFFGVDIRRAYIVTSHNAVRQNLVMA